MSVIVVGAGIVGLAVARELTRQRPDDPVTVIDKEPAVAAHQTGHNSGVIHAGIYYAPGSLKAELCRRGGALLKAFADDHGITYQAVGKLVVALDEAELPGLTEIERRARLNGVDDVVRLAGDGLRRIEPHAAGIAALHSPSTAAIDYTEVAAALARELVDVRLETELIGLRRVSGGSVVHTTQGDLRADEVVICAGLQSAQVAGMIGADPDPRIIPFRGEYYRLRPSAAAMVHGMIYPVPDPRYPFLGIHLTRRSNGTVDVGPNAVLALALEGYRRRDVSVREVASILSWPGFRAMARANWRTGIHELSGSLSKKYYLAQARRYLPELTSGDLMPANAGVRAQAVDKKGRLIDDFAILRDGGITIVRNAPSPAATSSLAIAERIVGVMRSA